MTVKLHKWGALQLVSTEFSQDQTPIYVRNNFLYLFLYIIFKVNTNVSKNEKNKFLLNIRGVICGPHEILFFFSEYFILETSFVMCV